MKKIIFLLCTTFLLTFSTFAQNNIRDVDFNNFTYSPDFCGGEDKRKITVKEGSYSYSKSDKDGFVDRMYFGVFGITYGDLDGDNRDEAVILSVCNTGGTGNFSEAYIYKMQNGKPKRVMLLVGGDRAYGGLREARIENGLLIVESNDAGEMGGACCPQNVVTNKYRFTGKTLKEVGKATKRKLYPEKRIKFNKGKFSKRIRVVMPADKPIQRFVVGASKGQRLIVTKNATAAKVNLWKGDAEVLDEDAKLVATLNKTGDYVFELRNFTDKDLLFDILVTIENPTKLLSPKKQNLPKRIKIESIYTDLDADKCKTIESSDEGSGSYVGECKGVGNYKLEVIEGDIRQSINVIHKQSGDKWELDFIGKVSSGFSSVGSKAEWRIKRINGKIQPIALIVRYNVSVPTEDGRNKNHSSLIVTKFDGEFVCITDVVPPMRKQNEKARELADVAASKPCYQKK